MVSENQPQEGLLEALFGHFWLYPPRHPLELMQTCEKIIFSCKFHHMGAQGVPLTVPDTSPHPRGFYANFPKGLPEGTILAKNGPLGKWIFPKIDLKLSKCVGIGGRCVKTYLK